MTYTHFAWGKKSRKDESQMNKVYETMQPGENLSWCKPIEYSHGEKRVIRIVCDGTTISMALYDGDNPMQEITRKYEIDGKGAMVYGYNYDSTFCGPEEGDADKAIRSFLGIDVLPAPYAHTSESAYEELGCAECPFRDECEAMEVSD